MRNRLQLCTGALALAILAGACAKPAPTQSLLTPSLPPETSEVAAPAPAPMPSITDVGRQQIEPALLAAAGFVEQQSDIAGIDHVLDVSSDAPDGEKVRDTVAADLLTTGHDIDIPLNSKVLSFVELFRGRLRSFIEDGLSRSIQYLPMIQAIFRAEGLPLDLAYVPLVESAFKPTAVSRAQARGMWQFMRGTALENGLRHDWYVDERAEPEKATRAAARYLKTLAAMFDGDWHLALASYNGGPGRVQRALGRADAQDFWKLSASSRYLPRETRDYVPLILAAIIIARNPAQYGMNIQPAPALAFERVTIPAAVDLRRVADWLGTPIESLRTLNPELRRWTTPLRDPAYDLKVPMGTGDILRAHLAAPDDLRPVTWYSVKSGDTLVSVAKKLGVTRTDLAEANYLSTRAHLQTGQQLAVPRAPSLVLANGNLIEPQPVAAAPAERVVRTSAASTRTSTSTVVYRVKRGDTLFSIARVYRTTVAALKRWNNLRSNTILVGQRLTILRDASVTSTD